MGDIIEQSVIMHTIYTFPSMCPSSSVSIHSTGSMKKELQFGEAEQLLLLSMATTVARWALNLASSVGVTGTGMSSGTASPPLSDSVILY